MTNLPPTFTEETKRETERTECVEKYVSELLGYLRDWAIIEPELTLILGNVRRMMNDLYEKRHAETLKEVRAARDEWWESKTKTFSGQDEAEHEIERIFSDLITRLMQ